MSKKSENVARDSESSTSQSDDEQKPEAKAYSHKPKDEKRETRGPGQKKRLPESEGATSSGIVLQPSHASKKDYTDQDVQSPLKRTRRDRPPLEHADAFDKSKCDCGEDSNHAPTCSMSNLELKDKSVGKEGNVASSETPGGCGLSAAGVEQSPKMDHLSVPVHGSKVYPTSPKKKGCFDGVKGISWNCLEKLSPKHSPDKTKSTSGKADLKLKQKSQRGKQLNLKAKSQASSSSSAPLSKKCDSSHDRSLPSTSSSDPNVEHPRSAKEGSHKFKSKAESSRASTSDDPQRRGETLNVPSGSGGPHSRQSSRSPSPSQRSRSQSRCICVRKPGPYDKHETAGCPQSAAARQTKVNNRSARITYATRYSTPRYSSSTASDTTVEYSRATKSKKTVGSMGSTRDAFPPETPRFMDPPLPGNNPNRRSPSRSPSPSTSQSCPGPSQCNCSNEKKRLGQHDKCCPCWLP